MILTPRTASTSGLGFAGSWAHRAIFLDPELRLLDVGGKVVPQARPMPGPRMDLEPSLPDRGQGTDFLRASVSSSVKRKY